MKLPLRYLPKNLTTHDRSRQRVELAKSRKLYKNNLYYTRKRVASFKSKPSAHVANARKIYGIDNVRPTRELARKTGCKLSALNQIVKKGEGAYYSSGSRPNQTAQSWGLARLASSITAGKSAAVDFHIIEKGCDHTKKAFRLAKQARKKYGFGNSKTRKVVV